MSKLRKARQVEYGIWLKKWFGIDFIDLRIIECFEEENKEYLVIKIYGESKNGEIVQKELQFELPTLKYVGGGSMMCSECINSGEITQA